MPDPVPNTVLRGGLPSERAQGLAQLVADVTGKQIVSPPVLAPVLLFSDPRVRSRLAVPTPKAEEVLVQDYQGIAYQAPFPFDVDLWASTRTTQRDATTEFRFSLADAQGPLVDLATGLRLFPLTDLGAAKATTFRPASLGDTVRWNDPVAFSQAQTDAYLALSGDDNPIHRDPEQAARLGLPAPVVPGLLLVSAIQPLVEAAVPGLVIASLKSRFLSPLCIGASLRLGVQVRAQGTDGVQKARVYLIDLTDRALAIVDLAFHPRA